MKKMQKWMKWVAMGAMVAVAAGCGGEKAKTGTDELHIGVVQIMEHKALDEANRGMTDAIKKGLAGRKIEFIQQNAQGDQSNLKTIAQGFVNRKVDLIAAISTPAAQAAANETQTIPIVGTAITDYVAAKLVKSNDQPGTNVTGTTDHTDADAQVKFIRELLPQAKRVGVMYNSGEVNSQLQAEDIRHAVEAAGLEYHEMTVTGVNDIQQVARSLATQVDVIYIPTDNVMASGMSTLIGVTNEAKIPVIGAAGTMVADGATASLTLDYYKLGYLAGEQAVRILKGEAKPENTPIGHLAEPGVLLNKAAVEELHIQVPEALAKRSEWK